MKPSHKILKIASDNNALKQALSRSLNISGILAQVLINRGIKTQGEAEKFLGAKFEHLLDPYSFTDMRKAVEIIRKAAKNGTKAIVFGDYDVDGITSTVLLKTVLARQGLDVSHYLPHRVNEGYGLNKNIVNHIIQNKINLLITADCGTGNQKEIEELKRGNVQVIVTDHHEPSVSDLPAADAIINAKTENSGYAYRNLAGVGVAYKLCQALTDSRLIEELDLVTLGTVADVVPLTGENRILVKEGLLNMRQSKRTGLQALLESSRIKDKDINAHLISFIIAPRLNASGRVDSAETSFNLLMSRHPDEARQLAGLIEGYNRHRQKIEGAIMDEAMQIIEQEINFKEHQVIVVARDNWHPGVLGIVASKIADRFYRPAIVISLGKAMCKGSARSIKNFHIFEALSGCRGHLDSFGGHAHAAGLMISRDNVGEFRRAINELAKKTLTIEDLLPSLDIDMELNLTNINEKIADEMRLLEPYGADNPEPLFYTRALKLKGEFRVMARNTIKFWVTDGNVTCQAIGFGLGDFKQSLEEADTFDLVYTLRIDNWQGETDILLEVRDIFLK